MPTLDPDNDRHQALFARLDALARNQQCWHCARPLTAQVQVGRCIYNAPCGCRLGQGQLTDDDGTPVARKAMPMTPKETP